MILYDIILVIDNFFFNQLVLNRKRKSKLCLYLGNIILGREIVNLRDLIWENLCYVRKIVKKYSKEI